jgi:tRNA(Ile)-lysidine synthase
VRLIPDGFEAVQARLDRHLSAGRDVPIAVAVSGGGDSLALMYLAATWAERHGRHLLVLSIDHGLNPDGSLWSARVAEAARRLGADWRGLVWIGPKPTTGLPAAARQARHGLLAGAARQAGAHVILMGHTADDVAETDWMRARGTPLGRLRAWSPSPVWPQGRGLMLLRPLLDVRRRALRDWLSAHGLPWIEDPANVDPRFQRSRARVARPDPGPPADDTLPAGDLICDPVSGLIRGPLETPWLAQAVVSASGRCDLPSAPAVARLRQRLADGTRHGVLGGARIEAGPDGLVVSREPGRRPPGDLRLVPGQDHVWDGRFAARAMGPGWWIGPAQGRRARLTAADRAVLSQLPAAARACHPVLFQHDDASPHLASADVEVTCLVPGRLSLATGQINSEDELAAAPWREPNRHPI